MLLFDLVLQKTKLLFKVAFLSLLKLGELTLELILDLAFFLFELSGVLASDIFNF